MASLYATLRALADEQANTNRASFMQQGKVQSIRGDGMLVVTVDGQARAAVPINDAFMKAGDGVWISGAEGGPPVVHGPRY